MRVGIVQWKKNCCEIYSNVDFLSSLSQVKESRTRICLNMKLVTIVILYALKEHMQYSKCCFSYHGEMMAKNQCRLK